MRTQKRKFEGLSVETLRAKLAETQSALSIFRAEREEINKRIAEHETDEWELGLQLDRAAPRQNPQPQIRGYIESQMSLREKRAKAKTKTPA